MYNCKCPYDVRNVSQNNCLNYCFKKIEKEDQTKQKQVEKKKIINSRLVNN
jgi:hypothetical protein